MGFTSKPPLESDAPSLAPWPGAENFAAAWDAAIAQSARRLVDIAFDRAIHGTDEPVFNRDGQRVGRRMRQNDWLLI